MIRCAAAVTGRGVPDGLAVKLGAGCNIVGPHTL